MKVISYTDEQLKNIPEQHLNRYVVTIVNDGEILTSLASEIAEEFISCTQHEGPISLYDILDWSLEGVSRNCFDILTSIDNEFYKIKCI